MASLDLRPGRPGNVRPAIGGGHGARHRVDETVDAPFVRHKAGPTVLDEERDIRMGSAHHDRPHRLRVEDGRWRAALGVAVLGRP